MTADVIARAGRSRRRRRLRLALAAVVAVLIVGIHALLPHPAPHTRPIMTISRSTATTAVPTAVTNGWPDPGTTAPLPADLTSRRLFGVAVPVSGSDGPHHQAAGLASGFAHNRAGAVLAATNLLLRITPQVGPAVFTPTLRAQVSGPNTVAMSEQVNAEYRQLCTRAHVTPGGPVGDLTASYVGYQIRFYSDTTTLLTILTEANRPGQAPVYAASVIQLAWVHGDWTLVAPAGGLWDQSITRIAAADVATFNPLTAGR